MTLHQDITNQSRNLSYTLLDKLNTIHNSKYDYSKVVYKNMKEPIIVVCPIHGDFIKTMTHHLHSTQGCPKCSSLTSAKKQAFTTEDFITQAKATHKDKYDYAKVNYINNNTKVTIICPVHGEFTQAPSGHLLGKNCQICANKNRAVSKTKSTHAFIQGANAIHHFRYDYSLVDYVNVRSKVSIICLQHGIFEQTPSEHLSGCGCQSCATYGFDYNKSAILYYLSINNGQAFKIGITNSSVEERYYKELDIINILWSVEFSVGREAYNVEQSLLKRCSAYRYNGPPLLISGNTELFNKDICPEFSAITIGDTDESGQTVVTLRQPPKPRATKPPSDLKSMEPLDVTEAPTEPVADDAAI